MRTIIIGCFCLGFITSPYIVKAQNGLHGPVNQTTGMLYTPVKVLAILKTDTGDVRTNNIIVMSSDIENIDLPAKGIAQKTLGPIAEDVVVLVTIKKNVQLLRLAALLAKYNIDAKYANLPVYVDGKMLTHPGPVLVADSIVKTVALLNSQIHITTNTGGRGALGLN